MLSRKNQSVTFPRAGRTAPDCVSHHPVLMIHVRTYVDDAHGVPGNTFDEGFELHLHLAFWVLGHSRPAHERHFTSAGESEDAANPACNDWEENRGRRNGFHFSTMESWGTFRLSPIFRPGFRARQEPERRFLARRLEELNKTELK